MRFSRPLLMGFCSFLHPDFSQNQVKEIFSLVRSPGYVDMQFPGIVLMCANEETGQGYSLHTDKKM